MSNKETIVALKSDEQASLSPGTYEVLTGAVERAGCTRESVDDALLIVGSYGQWGPDLNDAHRRQIVLADEVLSLRERLAHWRSFAVHAEGEHAAWKKTASELDAELSKLRLDRGLVERAADMLTAYAELIRRDGASHVEEHHYLPEVEHTATELRARFVFGA